MGGGQDKMFMRIYQVGLLFCIGTPKHEDEVLAFVAQLADDGIGESLPAAIPVRAGLIGPHRQHGVHR